jgi:hypothetical protein
MTAARVSCSFSRASPNDFSAVQAATRPALAAVDQPALGRLVELDHHPGFILIAAESDVQHAALGGRGPRRGDQAERDGEQARQGPAQPPSRRAVYLIVSPNAHLNFRTRTH